MATLPRYRTADGRWAVISKRADDSSVVRDLISYGPLGVADVIEEPPPPTDDTWPGVGIYTGTGDHVRAATVFKVDGKTVKPSHLTYYAQHSGLQGFEDDGKAIVDLGIIPVLTISTKTYLQTLPFNPKVAPGATRPNMQSILGNPLGRAAGPAAWDAAIAVIQASAVRAERIALWKTTPDAPNKVIVAPESEPDAKMNELNSNGLVINVGQPPYTKAEGRAELGRFFHQWSLVYREFAPHVERLIWFAQGQKENIAGMVAELEPGDFHIWAGDPYFNSTGTALGPKDAWNSKWLTFIKSNADYIRCGRPRLAITEFGMTIGTPPHTDPQVARFMGDGSVVAGVTSPVDLHEEMVSAGVEFCIWFCVPRDNDHDFLKTSSTGAFLFPNSVAAFAKNLARNRINGGGPAIVTPPSTVEKLTGIAATLTSIGDPAPGVSDPTQNSGLVISSKSGSITTPLGWGVTDDGDAMLYAVDLGAGTHAIRHKLYFVPDTTPETRIVQLEDVAWGPGSVLYAAQVGAGTGTTKSLYRVTEPTVSVTQSPVVTSRVTPIRFTFTIAFSDMEAFFIDPVSGKVYIFEKLTPQLSARPSGTTYRSRMATLPALGALTTSQAVTATVLTGTVISHESSTATVDAMGGQSGITSADISRDGSFILLCNLQEVWGYSRDVAAGQSVEEAIAAGATAHRWYDPAGGGSTWGSEAIAFSPWVDEFAGWGEGAGTQAKKGALTIA